MMMSYTCKRNLSTEFEVFFNQIWHNNPLSGEGLCGAEGLPLPTHKDPESPCWNLLCCCPAHTLYRLHVFPPSYYATVDCTFAAISYNHIGLAYCMIARNHPLI